MGGRRYPFNTSNTLVHDHSFCDIAAKVIQKHLDGGAEWGEAQYMPAIEGKEDTVYARQGLFRGRNCKRTIAAHGPYSMSVHCLYPDGTTGNAYKPYEGNKYVLVVRIWPVSHGRQEVKRRAEAGEELAYNPYDQGAVKFRKQEEAAQRQ